MKLKLGNWAVLEFGTRCRKVCYSYKYLADMAAAEQAGKRLKSYFCPKCQMWHLTKNKA